ncbi:MAG: hypothetical protein JSS72_05730 [Armatimonadetes bacterium]|nr:hypothetical protein [Armatimonadota bacterium]
MTTQQLLESPAYVVMSIVIWIPITVWIISMVHWAVSGEIDVLTAFLGVCTALGLGILAIVPPAPFCTPLASAAAFLTVLLYPYFRNMNEKRQLGALEVQGVEKAYEQLAFRPDNVGAKLKLAKLLWGRGLYGYAIAISEKTLRGLPENVFHEEFKMLTSWKNQFREKPTSLPCLDCGTQNDPGNLHCKRCGAPFLLYYARGAWLGPDLTKRVLNGWVAAMALIVGFPAAAMTLNRVLIIPAVIILGGAAGYFTYLAVKPSSTS